MRRWWLAAIFCAAAVAHAAQPGVEASSAPSDEELARYIENLDRHADTVIDSVAYSRNARVLIAAASLALDNPLRRIPAALASKRDALVARARRLGADDPLVWWLIASDWPGLPAAERAVAVRRLRQIAPNNAAGWLLLADAADDVDANLARAAQANRIDLYEGEYVRALHAAASAAPAPDFMRESAQSSAGAAPDTRLKLALTKWMERSLPPLGEATQRCNGTLALAGTRQQECLALARLMANRSRSVLLQRLGTLLLLQRLPPGEERDAVAAARRRLDWVQEQSFALLDQEWPPGVQRWLEPDGDELTATHAMLEAAGISPEPPPGWNSRSQPVLPAPLPAD